MGIARMSYGFREARPLRSENEKDSCGVGFVANIKGKRSHGIIRDAVKCSIAWTTEGAYGCEANTGDGAGVLTGLPFEFLTAVAKDELGVILPEPGKVRRRFGFFTGR